MHFVLAFVLLFVLAVGIGQAAATPTSVGAIASCVPPALIADHAPTRAPGQSGQVARPAAGLQAGRQDHRGRRASRSATGTSCDQAAPRRSTPAHRPGRVRARRPAADAATSRWPSIPGRPRVPTWASRRRSCIHAAGLSARSTRRQTSSARHPDVVGIGASATCPGDPGPVLQEPRRTAGRPGQQRGRRRASDRRVVAGLDQPGRPRSRACCCIVASLNIFVGVFNLLPLLPLDGGHLAIVIFERIRAWFARLRGRPDPGLVDYPAAHPLSVLRVRLLVGFGMLLIAADIVNPVHIIQCKATSDHDSRPRHASASAGAARAPPQVPPDHGGQGQARGAGRRRRAGVGAVDDHDADRRRERHAAADRRADRRRLPDRPGGGARPRTTPTRCRRSPASRRSRSSPTSTSSRSTSSPRSTPAARRCGSTRQHQGVRRQGRRDRQGGLATRACRSGSASTPARWTSGCWPSTARPRRRRWSSRRCGSARCSRSTASRHQDLGQAPRPGGDDQRLPAARRSACDYPLHLGVTEAGPDVPGHRQVRGRVRRAAGRGHRRHDPGVAVGAAGRGSQGRHRDPGVARHAPARPGDRVLPVLRPRPGGRLHPGRRGDGGAGGHGRAAAGGGHGLRRQRSGRGARGRPRRRVGQRQGPDLRPRRGHQDRARVPDRRDAHRRGHEAGRATMEPAGAESAEGKAARLRWPALGPLRGARRPARRG